MYFIYFFILFKRWLLENFQLQVWLAFLLDTIDTEK